jgi:DNA polymerase I-like protein with 3'-5' exonuclease and polymerase domains
LDYISSLYCHYHWYWKEDGKEWDAKGDLKQLLDYNCLDCIRTFEAVTALRQLITQLGMERQWNETKQRMALALRMMLRGVRIDRARRGRLKVELTTVLSQIYTELEQIIPQSWLPPPKKGAKNTPWYRSPKQQQIVFGEILGMKIPKHRKTGRPTLGKEAMQDLPKRYPEFTGLFSRLEDARSVAVFQSHFVEAPLDTDDRMRCSFNPAGTETFRWNSSANAFGSGTNLQNIPQGDEA